MNKIYECTINFSKNKNKRIYTKALVKKLSEKINENPKSIYLQWGLPDNCNIELKKIVGNILNTNYNEHSNCLEIKFQAISSILNNINEKEFNKYFSIVPNGVGEIDRNNYVKDNYTLISFSVLPKQDSAFYE